MPVILRIAVRNLKEHKIKSIIIMALIALGMILLVIGNSVIDTGKVGIEKSFIQSLSGHILIGPKGENGELPGVMGASGGFAMGPGGSAPAVIPDYLKTLQAVKAIPGVKAVNPQVYSTVMGVLDGNWRAGIGVFGIDPVQYQAMFPGNVKVSEGRFLEPGEEGIMLSQVMYDDITQDAGMALKLGDKIKLQSFGQGNSKIKSLPVVGIFTWVTDNSSMQELCLADANSMRYLNSMVTGAGVEEQVDAAASDLLSVDISGGYDSFFQDDVVSEGGDAPAAGTVDFENILGDTSRRADLAKADSNAWMYLLVRLENGEDAPALIQQLNQQFKAEGSNLVAVDWQAAAGAIAALVTAVQIFFYIMVFIITVVSVIIIMNTMVVSIMERTAEIGTMRALGARKGYIRTVFMSETFALALVGGLIGLVLGIAIILVANVVGVPAPNPLFQLVFGGDVLHPVVSGYSALSALVIMVAVGLLSGLYPTALALKVQPIKAMQS